MPIIYYAMAKNGSPKPTFETDEDRTYFLCTIPIHPLAKSILDHDYELRRNKGKAIEYSDLSGINSYLSLSVSQIVDRDIEAINNSVSSNMVQVLQYCTEAKSRDEIFKTISLYNNTKNFQKHIKPLIDMGWLQLTLPDKRTSIAQQYYTTDLGKQLLKIITYANSSGMERTHVASSNIESVGYDKSNMILEVEFHNGGIYQYFNVPKKVYIELIKAPSHESYFMHEVKDKFKYQKVK